MKVTFKKDVDCDYYDCRMDETYPKVFRKWVTIRAEAVENEGAFLNIALEDGNTILNVPRGAVEVS
jgi:transposase-like protein